MARVLLIGIDADAVDFSDPALPPGLDAEKIRQGVKASLAQLNAAGHDPYHHHIPADPAGLGGLADLLVAERFDCVVIGGGVRLPPRNLPVFEAALNIVAAALPSPKIALTATPLDAPAAVKRVMGA